MIDNIERKILTKFIKASDYITSKDIAFSLDLSEKTVLKYLNNLKKDLEDYGATLEVKHGHGSILKINNQALFNKYLAEIGTNDIPSTKVDRRSYILSRLVNSKDYVNLYELADELYISPSLLRILIRDLEETVSQYNLEFDHSHSHGYRLIGNEDDIRRLLSNECHDHDRINNLSIINKYKEDLPVQISSIVAKTLEKYHIVVSNDAIESLTLHFLIAINRNETKNNIDVDEVIVRKIQSSAEFYVIRNINKQLTELYDINLPEIELAYLTLHLNGKQRLIAHEHLQVKIDNDALVFYNKFLRNIYQSSYYDFFDDQELRVSLLNHIVPFINRLNNNNQIQKSSLTGIKNEFPFAYELSLIGLSFLEDSDIKISPAEIGYFALHLALSMEKKKNNNDNYSIAIIATELSGLYNMMSFKITKYLDNPSITIKYYNSNEAKELTDEQISVYNVILNTTDELFSFNNVLNVSNYLNDDELENIKTYLKENENSFYYNLFNKKAYMLLEDLDNKEDVIKTMLKQCKKIYDVEDDMLEKILKRESIVSTEYANYIAIPHAIKVNSGLEWVAVAKLNKPIVWKNQKVQLVFLINLYDHLKISWFMQKISKAIAKENVSKSLIEPNDFDTFMNTFKKIN